MGSEAWLHVKVESEAETHEGRCARSIGLVGLSGRLEISEITEGHNRWGCPPSKFPWTYSDKETCYLLQGKVKVTPDGSNESVEIGAGDLVEFPKGMSCTWNVSVAVDKHYNFS